MGSRETTARTVTTKTKTKTKMPSKNIIVVSGPSLAASRSRRGGTDKNYSLWGGGSTTVVSPDGSNGDVILAELECVPSVVKYKVNTENTNRPGRANKRQGEQEEDRADPDQHPEPHQSVGASQDQLRPQHSELREPGETTDSDGPAQSQHSGSPHLPVTQHCTVTSCQHFIKNFII